MQRYHSMRAYINKNIFTEMAKITVNQYILIYFT